jgi:uncharacterized membrane protein YjgN (DUF898 family)
MSCWPANFVSAFFVALLIFDLVQKEYDAMPGHIVVGLVLIVLFFVLCWILGDTVTGAILVVPAVVLVIFLFAVWFTNKYQTPKTTSGPLKFKGLAYLVRKDGVCVDSSAPLPVTVDASKESSCVVTSLNATTIS